ncbi:hypothetical protein [Pedobacter jeongneungensis]|uniref:hypothetical protein n=1 Tax=Pedobacter jeongneungensis TaxID=947309 RepID=UPI00046ACDDA|nr:hypothetical protein [Pedobacter jeongneungensis]
MTGIELTERLIEDLRRSVHTRNTVPDVITQIKNIGNDQPADFLGALNTISFDAHLSIVSNIISLEGDVFIPFDGHNINEFAAAISGNKAIYADKIQSILDNEDLVGIDLNFGSVEEAKPISETLIKELEEVHNFSGNNL